MRVWNKYLVRDKTTNNVDRFSFTNQQLIEDHKNYKDNFNFEIFKKKELCIKIFNFLQNNLQNTETLFIGSSWGWWEYFLKDKFKVIASDINNRKIKFHNKNTNLKYIKLDILNLNHEKKKIYEQIVVNNIEYLFDDIQLQKCIQNISKLSKKGTRIFVIFRSREGFIQKFIDQFLAPIETFLYYLKKRLTNKIYFIKEHYGYRREISKFILTWGKNNFKHQSTYEDMHELEFNRLRIVEKLKISKILSKIFFKSSPYLNVIIFEKQ